MSRLPRSRLTLQRKSTTILWAVLVAGRVLLAAATAADPPAPGAIPPAVPVAEGALPFHRVRVPAGRLGEVPLGGHRLVPVPLEEFERALEAAAGNADGDREPPTGRRHPRAIVDALCTARLDTDGRWRGTVSFDLPADDLPGTISLGRVPVGRGTCSADGTTVEVALHGLDGSRIGFVASRAGRYAFTWALPPTADGARLALPLPPALRTAVELALPPGTTPLLEGQAWARPAVAMSGRESAEGEVWRIDVGPLDELVLSVVAEKETPRSLGCWQHVAVGRGQVHVTAVFVPAAPWRAAAVSIDADPRLLPEAVTVAGLSGSPPVEAEWARTETGTGIEVRLPVACLGTTAPLTILAVAPLPAGRGARDGEGEDDDAWLPLMWPRGAEWSGGGIRLECDPGLALVDIASERCLPVAEEKTVGWPLPVKVAAEGERVVVTLEAQAPEARVRVGVQPRGAVLDVARVTTVDVVSTVVTGRAACDLRVRGGAAFEVNGRIAPGWFIDSVDAVEQGGGGGDTAATAAALDWRVVRDERGDRLRIGFPTAATPQRGFTLSISGHRAGIGTDVPFACADMDMVRLDGETAGQAILALTSAPETTIELDPPSPPPAVLPERLAALTAKAAFRAWIPVDDAAMAAPASLLERRPPVEADSQVRLTVIDDRIAESFTFSCRPGAAALDAVLVHFSEPTDDALEWSLLPPAGGTLTVRRVDRRGERAVAAGGESWLVELEPPARDEVQIRATRVVPFPGPVAVPLAWVDGSDPQHGDVVIVNAGRRRPQIVNRRLDEMPGWSADDDLPKGTLAEFTFTPPTDPAPAVTPAAEIVPGGRDRDDEARAWVWNEETTCWCHPTGVTEYETRFEIENHGRTKVAVTPPVGVLARGVVIDGVTATVVPDTKTGALLVDLPPDRRFVSLVVRSEGSVTTTPIAWDVPLAGAGIDVPVLERTWQVLLPDGVDLAALPVGFKEVAAARTGWLERLLPVTVRGRPPRAAAAAPGSRQGTIDAGFRERVLVPLASRGQGVSVRVIHARWLWGAALVVCVAFVAAGFLTAGRVARLLLAVALAVAAEWLPLPLDGLARAGLWGLAVAALLRWATARWRAALPLLVMSACLLPAAAAAQPAAAEKPASRRESASAAAAEEGSLPVFIVPGLRLADGNAREGDSSGETALVPEPLYRVLANALGRQAAEGVRVHAVRLRALPGGEGRWTLDVDLDTDAGGLITLRQDGQALWDDSGPRVDGEQVAPTADSDTRLLRVGFANAGRHRLEAGLSVRPVRAGDIDSVTVSLPFSPRSELFVDGPLPVGGGDAAVVQVESFGADGFPRPVRRPEDDRSASGAFDISRATHVRLAWAGDGGTRIVDGIPTVESRNDLSWDDGGCRLTATYAIDPGDQIVRSLVIDADPRLGSFALPDPGFVASPLGGGRFLVEAKTPRRGRITVVASFLMPLADPVGVFDLPAAWLEAAASDARTTHLEPSPELIVKATLPEDATLLPPRGAGGPVGSLTWRSETGRAGRPSEFDAAVTANVIRPAAAVPARVSVERRRQGARGSQRLDAVFLADGVRLRLEARLDAGLTPLVTVPVVVPEGAEIEQVSLREDRGNGPPPSDGGLIGVRWRRDGPRRILVVVQRPRSGAFMLDVAVSLPGAPAPAGPLPLVRAVLEPGGPLTVTWRMAEGRVGLVGEIPPGDDGEERQEPASSGSIEVAADTQDPPYRISERGAEAADDGEPGDGPPPPPAVELPAGDRAGGPRVEFVETHLAIDARGRAWGVSRFDVVAADPVVRIRIPSGMRMFDVFVDGRIANDAIPARTSIAENAWELRLLDIGWPRSIVAVYAGEVSDGLPLDGALEVATPSIVGLSTLRSAWVVEVPEGIVVRSLPPTEAVDEQAMTAARRAAIERLAGEYERAMAGAAADDASRLGDFLRQRRREAVLPMPAAWSHVGMRDSHAAAAWSPPLRLLQDGEAPGLRLAVARRGDGSMPGRAMVTVAMLLGVVVLLEARRRTPIVSRLASTLLAPWWVAPAFLIGGGVLWIANLDPTWPGWLAAVAGAGGILGWMPGETRRFLARRRRHPRTFAPGGITGETVTRAGAAPRPATAPGSSASRHPSGSTVRPGG
jgi:hypothetical protein